LVSQILLRAQEHTVAGLAISGSKIVGEA
jgi:hypothetical protein